MDFESPVAVTLLAKHESQKFREAPAMQQGAKIQEKYRDTIAGPELDAKEFGPGCPRFAGIFPQVVNSRLLAGRPSAARLPAVAERLRTTAAADLANLVTSRAKGKEVPG